MSMINDKAPVEKTSIETDVERTDSPEQGRQPAPTDAPITESTDISHVDQQEGAMQNGALGGNFETAPDVSKK